MEKIPWLLLDKHFKGLLSDKDQKELAVWVKSSAENRILLQEIEADLQNGLSFPGDFSSDKQAVWQKIQDRINIPELNVFSRKRLYRAVAAVAIPLLFVSFASGWFVQKAVQYSADCSAYTVIISPKGQRTQVVLT